MVEYRSKLERTKTKARRAKAKIKRDVLVPGNFALILTPVLLIAWFVGTISSLNRNWELQQEIAERKLEEQYLSLEIESLSLENQYYASEEYQELAARKLQNKKLPGETLIYLPPNSDLARNKYATIDPADLAAPVTTTNFEQWLTYLFGV